MHFPRIGLTAALNPYAEGMGNRLAEEKSLYLRQHAENPVDWYPWGDEAMQRARAEDKPLLVSIGYSACHWCHVMAHESFEDAYIARLMNEHFVCVKVDREELPDVDAIYMEAVQMLNGHGGWPLNVFCMPDGRPFAGGTYFPPDERRGGGIVPWPQLLVRVSDFYRRQRQDLEDNAAAIVGNLAAGNLPHGTRGEQLEPGDLIKAAQRLVEQHDPEFGGFGGAPKFPPSMTLDFLLAVRSSAAVDLGQPELAGGIDQAINRTLTGMAHGGIFDQFGGGFARYSVDAHWLIPHFEKMLYDNAQLIDIYSRAWQRYPKPLYAAVVEETIGWLDREMAHPDGGYMAALDADTDGEEGLTYLWTPQQVEEILGSDAAAELCAVYGITEEGNFEHSGNSLPTLLEGDIEVRRQLAGARRKLRQARDQRPQPGRDEKRLVAWNALLIRGLCRAAWTFGRPDWLSKAEAIANWIWTRMHDGQDGLHRLAYDDDVRGMGTLDDHAFSAEAFITLAGMVDWQRPGTSTLWLERAGSLVQSILNHFDDPRAVGCFFTSDKQPALVHRKKNWYDQAQPSGNSSLLHSLAWLGVLTGSPQYRGAFSRLSTAYPGIADTAPSAASYALAATTQNAIGLAFLECPNGTNIESIRKLMADRPWRPIFIKESQQAITEFKLCIGQQCLAPSQSFEPLLQQVIS